MKAIKKLFDTTTKLVVALALLALLLVWVILFFVDRETAIALVKPILWSLLLVAVTWLAIHYGVKAWRKRKRTEFDERVAAKEGIEDRRREWSTWTEELEKQGIDRYELPFYLLVGEPQSGKSVLLHNSDLHFPFGQSRLSGVGGTRGCDWWFTEEAVILDLAGRLFTHEGGAADRLEFEAFLELLAEFRPLCPANGVILVIPCDSLLKDTAEQCGAKATKIQNALLALTTKLQAQLPVYLVLTKGDQVFGFAESVHRLDVERRHQMFGWSRPADRIDNPFDVTEVLTGYEELVHRARLLRAHMTAGARLPEALPEVDRMYAFPHELAGMQANLEVYLKRIFTASNVTDRVFFRGIYLTSGLQSGVPIAKVCTELFGQAGEADRRNLEALFSKQRAYFIKDLIRTRVFGERGLVRPTQGRVQQTRRTSLLAYGLAGAIVLATLVFVAVYLLQGRDDEQSNTYAAAIQAGKSASADEPGMPGLLFALQQISDAVEYESPMAEKAFESARDDFKELYCTVFDRRLVPLVHSMALNTVAAELESGRIPDHARLLAVCGALIQLTKPSIDFSSKEVRDPVLGVLEDATSGRVTREGGGMLSLGQSFELRAEYGDDEGLLLEDVEDGERVARLVRTAFAQLEGCFEPGVRTQPREEVGFMLAWMGAAQSYKALLAGPPPGEAIPLSVRFASCMQLLKDIETSELGAGSDLDYADVILPAARLRREYHSPLREYLRAREPNGGAKYIWPRMNELVTFTNESYSGLEGPLNLSSIGAHFGSEDAGQTAFQALEGALSVFSAKMKLGSDRNPYEDLNDELKLLDVCARALPADLRNGGLPDLAQRIVDLDTRIVSEGASDAAENVFMGQCLEVADALSQQLPDVDAALAAFEQESPGPVVAELVGIHRAWQSLVERRNVTGDKLARFRASQAHLEVLIDRMLQTRGPVSQWLPPPSSANAVEEDAWGLIDVLLAASDLELARPDAHSLARTAPDAVEAAFASQGNQLYERWQARGEASLAGIGSTVQELGLLANQVDKRLALAELRGPEIEAWSSRVDTLMQKALAIPLQDVQRLWKPALDLDLPLSDVTLQAKRELGGVAAKITESQSRGLFEIGSILKELQEGGPILNWMPLRATRPILAELREWNIPSSPSHVTGDPQFQQLDLALDRVLAAASDDALAAEYAKSFRAPAVPIPAVNAGVRMVQRTRTEYAGRLAREVRGRYLTALQQTLDNNRNGELFELLFWQPGDDVSRYDDTDLRDKLDAFFKRNGELDKLLARYRLTGPESIAAELFTPTPADDEGDWGGVHRFLVALAEFLRAGDDKRGTVAGSSFSFTLVPEVSTTGSVWNVDSLDPAERKDWFYYPGDDSAAELQKAAVGPSLGKLKVSNWGFEVNRDDRALLLLWSRQSLRSAAVTDPSRYWASFPGCLGPLLLAWSGTPLDDAELDEYVVPLVVTGTSRRAPLRVQFERPLPARPPKP